MRESKGVHARVCMGTHRGMQDSVAMELAWAFFFHLKFWRKKASLT